MTRSIKIVGCVSTVAGVVMVCRVELCYNRMTLCRNAVTLFIQTYDGHSTPSSVVREVNVYRERV
jgi:hypothetical protein